MAGVYKLTIDESEADLKQLLRQQKTAVGKERVQLLFLLKSGQAKTIQDAAKLLGRHRVTVQDWLRRYRSGGLDQLLERKVARSGRPRTIPAWAEQALQERLQESQGFEGYQEICDWLESQLGIKAAYKTVHSLVRYRLKAASKVSRPSRSHRSAEPSLPHPTTG